MTQAQHLLHLLQQLSPLMDSLGLWQQEPPSLEALSSQEPFSVDTLRPEQWLQWEFIPKMQALIEQQGQIPKGFSITPYFSECWKEHTEYGPLLTLLASIDEVCA
ncbi:YqcC family protein [Vibrio sinaloensis]|uniref:YqcC family protein n=1 Tax=Photobacterium sp. (strain ATCC 43367) TaxID=379097 RepID=UPI0035E54409